MKAHAGSTPVLKRYSFVNADDVKVTIKRVYKNQKATVVDNRLMLSHVRYCLDFKFLKGDVFK